MRGKPIGLLLVLLQGAAAVLSGCVSAQPDLSEPVEWTELVGDPVAVVRGETVLPIVVDSTAKNQRAALFLAGVLEKACGRRPRVLIVLKGQTCGFEHALFVGGEAPAPVPEGGFRVIAKDGSIRFLGRADYAVYDWCERELGFRWYCEEGRCVGRRDAVVVSPVDYADHPVFEHREMSGGQPWIRIAKAGSTHRGGVNVHAPHGWFRDARLKAERPEIFETGKTPMLCYGNPETLAYYRRRIDRHIAGLEDSGGIVNTNRKVVTVCQWDAPIRCMCKWCRTRYDYARGEAGLASPVIWAHFLAGLSAWLKDAHPDYMISFLPYLNTCGVPADAGLALADNCEAEVCTMPGLALLKDGPRQEREEKILRDWQAATGRKVLNWHYGCWPQERTSAPYVFGKTIARHYRNMRDVSCGTFVCGGTDDPRLALSMYVWMKCLWNPAIDVEAVYDGFARRMFGPAERPMRELIALQEECWNRPWDTDECTYRNVFEVSFPRADVRRMKDLLRQAQTTAQTAGDETSARRVAWYASGFSRFFAESDVLDRRLMTRGSLGLAVRLGATNEFVRARDVYHAKPWMRTTVMTRREREDELVLTVRCDDPAAAKMDFSSIDDDFVWGDDSVTFAFESDGTIREAKVYRDGSAQGVRGDRWLTAAVTHDAAGWTVTARVRLPRSAQRRGFIRGNVCRWRVGDRRQPEAERVPGSRYEHCRLNTCYTRPDGDPAAFAAFTLDAEKTR